MLRFTLFDWLARMTSKRRPAPRGRRRPPAPRCVPRLLALEDRTLPSVFTVANLDDSGLGSLRQAVLDANANPGLDLIVFAPAARGAVGLTSGQLSITDDLAVVGPGAEHLAVSGSHQSRVFSISGGATVVLTDLTITNGLATGAPGQGGGILNTGSNLTVANVVFSNNEARSAAGDAQGGAIANFQGARLTVAHSLFTDNQAIAGGNNGLAGAIHMNQGTLTVTHTLFVHNRAIGSNSALAGALNTAGSTATISDSTFMGNQSIGGSGGTTGFSRGGGVYNANGTLTVVNSTFIGNQALGGSNNTGSGNALGVANGGGMQNSDRGILFLTGSTFTGNQAIGGSNNTSTGGRSYLSSAFHKYVPGYESSA